MKTVSVKPAALTDVVVIPTADHTGPLRGQPSGGERQVRAQDVNAAPV